MTPTRPPQPQTSLGPRVPEDLDDIVGWIPNAQALYLFTGPQLTWPINAADLAALEHAQGFIAWVMLLDDDQLAGQFELALDGVQARLVRMIVNPSLRGMGLAARLVELATIEATRLGAQRLVLRVIGTNEPAIRAYERAGLAAVGWLDDRPDVLTMGRTLTGGQP